jgi:O-antigen ligase
MLKYLFYLSLLSLVLGQFTALFKSSGANLYLFDITVGIFVLYGIFVLLLSKKVDIPKYLIIYVLFCFLAGLSLFIQIPFLSSEQLFVASSYLFRLIIYVLAGFVVYSMLRYELITKNELMLSIIFSGLVLAIFGFFQLIVLPDFEILNPALGWDPHKRRLASTFFDPNFAGGYLSICLALVLHLLLGSSRSLSKISSKVLIICGFILLLALFLTFSRSAWLFFAIVVFVFGIFRSRWLLLFAIILVFLAYFAVPRVQTRLSGITDPADSAYFRYVSWQNTVTIAHDNLLFGVGFNTFRYTQAQYGFFGAGQVGGHSGAGSDSSFLLVLATTGIFGFTFFILAYMFPIVEVIIVGSEYRVLLLAVFGGILAQSQFINAVFFPPVMFLIFVLLGLFSYYPLRR